MINYCKNCLLPSTKPDLFINEVGICSACTAYSERKQVDWKSRSRQFFEIVNRYKSNSWDCIVPVSGGKDSTAQALKMRELGLNPLCVNSRACDLSQVGRANLENLRRLGFDLVEFSPKLNVRRQINKLALKIVGDISWPEHVGIFTIPIKAAIYFKVPLIVWGENSQNEYGGPALSQHNPTLDRRWLEEFGGLLGLRVEDLINEYGFDSKDLELFTYPSDERLKEVGVTGLFLGHFFPWHGHINAETAIANGFRTFDDLVEGSVVNYENLDNHQTGIHDYFKFLKFGFGRATDLISVQIRRGLISREEGLNKVIERDGKYPHTYLGKPLESILSDIDMGMEEFNSLCDDFTNKKLFKMDKEGNLLRKEDYSLIKINYDNEG